MQVPLLPAIQGSPQNSPPAGDLFDCMGWSLSSCQLSSQHFAQDQMNPITECAATIGQCSRTSSPDPTSIHYGQLSPHWGVLRTCRPTAQQSNPRICSTTGIGFQTVVAIVLVPDDVVLFLIFTSCWRWFQRHRIRPDIFEDVAGPGGDRHRSERAALGSLQPPQC